MISSLNTNSGSNSAINSFGSAQSAVHSAQKHIATGKKVADAKRKASNRALERLPADFSAGEHNGDQWIWRT